MFISFGKEADYWQKKQNLKDLGAIVNVEIRHFCIFWGKKKEK